VTTGRNPVRPKRFRPQTGQNINVAANGIAKLLRMMMEEDE
jgi:hypothetical protein